MTSEGVHAEALVSRTVEGTVHSGPATSPRGSLREDDSAPPSTDLQPKCPACLSPEFSRRFLFDPVCAF